MSEHTAPRRHVCYIRHISGFSLGSFPHSKVNLMMQLNCHIVKMHRRRCWMYSMDASVCLAYFIQTGGLFNNIIECDYWNKSFYAFLFSFHKDDTSNRFQLTFTDYLKRTSFDGMWLCLRVQLWEGKIITEYFLVISL